MNGEAGPESGLDLLPLAGERDSRPRQPTPISSSAEQSLARLTSLVDNLLDTSRLEAGVLGANPAPLALDEAVPYALDEIGGPASEVGLDIPVGLPAVLADADLLQRILVNVIANAFGFGPEGDPPLPRRVIAERGLSSPNAVGATSDRISRFRNVSLEWTRSVKALARTPMALMERGAILSVGASARR